ncbi:hypothetical protein DCC62_29340 [candidate division KSB1 bacterium]|nr:MAG: hypothetical protein DCC62_29340 [candidate division KSB1 bacterium]
MVYFVGMKRPGGEAVNQLGSYFMPRVRQFLFMTILSLYALSAKSFAQTFFTSITTVLAKADTTSPAKIDTTDKKKEEKKRGLPLGGNKLAQRHLDL